jgi:hypothetical protein
LALPAGNCNLILPVAFLATGTVSSVDTLGRPRPCESCLVNVDQKRRQIHLMA